MTSKESRQQNRRQLERRSRERRRIPYQFGSIEWLNAIRNEYILWPKQDRRHQDRRSEDRRIGSRRTSNLGYITSSKQTKRLHNLLTAEEKQMLNQLIQHDDSDD